MRRFTVMGFTEAELGFVLAAAFAALAVSVYSDEAQRANSATSYERVVAERDSLARSFAAYRDTVQKKSNKTPRCTEKGEPPAPVADIRVLARDRYGLAGEQMNFAALRARLAPHIDRSAALGCRYLVISHATKGVDGPDHSAAMRRLWALFDVDDRER